MKPFESIEATLRSIPEDRPRLGPNVWAWHAMRWHIVYFTPGASKPEKPSQPVPRFMCHEPRYRLKLITLVSLRRIRLYQVTCKRCRHRWGYTPLWQQVDDLLWHGVQNHSKYYPFIKDYHGQRDVNALRVLADNLEDDGHKWLADAVRVAVCDVPPVDLFGSFMTTSAV